MEEDKTTSNENLKLRKCYVKLNKIPENVIKSYLKNPLKKEKTIKQEPECKEESEHTAYETISLQENTHEREVWKFEFSESVKEHDAVADECKDGSAHSKSRGTCLKSSENLNGKKLNTVNDPSILINSPLAEIKSVPRQPNSVNVVTGKVQLIGRSDEKYQAVKEDEAGAKTGDYVMKKVNNKLVKPLEKKSFDESKKSFCGFDKDDLYSCSKLWTKHSLNLFLNGKVKLKSCDMAKIDSKLLSTDVNVKIHHKDIKKVDKQNLKKDHPKQKAFLPILLNQEKDKSSNRTTNIITDALRIEVSEKFNEGISASYSHSSSSKVKEIPNNKKLSSLFNDIVKEKLNSENVTDLSDLNSSGSSIVKAEKRKDSEKTGKVLRQMSTFDKSVTVTTKRPIEICNMNYSVNKAEDLSDAREFLESRNLDPNIKKKNRIYNIPGITFIIGIKPEATSKLKKNCYDCVICNLKETSLFSGEEMKKHVQSRHHLINVLQAENYSLYSLYKDDNGVANKSICSEILKYEEKRGMQKLSVAKSKESHLLMREAFTNRIKELIAVQEGSRKSILDLISLDCQRRYLKSQNFNAKSCSFDTIVLVGDSRVDNLCIPQIEKSEKLPRVLHDSRTEAKIGTIIDMIENNLQNISSHKVLVIVLGLHWDIWSLLNHSMVTTIKESYLKEMISTINTNSEKWKKSFSSCKFIWCLPCVPDFKRLNSLENSTGQVTYDEYGTFELKHIRNYFKILIELKRLWKTCITHAMVSLELDLNMVFSKNIHRRQEYFTSFTDEDKLPKFIVQQTTDGFHFSPNMAKIFWRHILRRAKATDLMHILNSFKTKESANVDLNSLQISDDSKEVLSSLQTEEVSNEVFASRQIKGSINEVFNLPPNLIGDHHEISSLGEASKSFFKYNQVTLIADHRYGPYLKQWKSKEILILEDELLTIKDIKTFLTSKKKLFTGKTLYLVVIGIHFFAKMVVADICKKNGCDSLSVLHAIQPLAYRKFIRFISQKVSELSNTISEAKLRLPNDSDIAILPPLPISLMPLYDDHRLLHDKHNTFSNYMIVNSEVDNLRAQYTVWMRKLTNLALWHLSSHINCGNLQNSLDDKYYLLEEMSCSSTDKPIYYKWKDVVKNILNIALPFNTNINEVSETQFTNHDLMENFIKTPDNALENLSKYLLNNRVRNLKKVAYDHLVLIGKIDSLTLLDGLDFCTFSKWCLDDDFNYETNIDIIKKNGFNRVLFVFVSDVSMIGSKNLVTECIKQQCKRQLSFIGPSDKFDSLDLNLKQKIIIFREIMSQIEKCTDIQSQIIVAPFTPGFYVHIANIILFHSKMHSLLEHQTGISFVRGYSMKLWDDILKSFEVEWKKLSVDFSNMCIKENISIYDKNKSISVNWKSVTLLGDSNNKVDTAVVTEWKTCVMSLILKGWAKTHQPISVIENCGALTTSWSPAKKYKPLMLSNLIQVDLNSETNYSEEKIKVFPNESSLSTISENNSYCGAGLIPLSNVRSLQENTKNLSGDCHDITNATVTTELDDVILFAKQILNSKKILKTHSKKYDNTFIIGKQEIVSKLANLNINSTLIYEDISKFVNIKEDMESLMNQIYLKAGIFLENFVCCVLFDISLIVENIGRSPECVNHGCHESLDISDLKTKNVYNLQTNDGLDMFIADHLHNIKLFIDKLSKVVPVVILPLFPARIYCCDMKAAVHQTDHHMASLGCTLVQGPKYLWEDVLQALILSWNDLMKKNIIELDKCNYFDAYISRKQNTFSFLDNNMIITKNWMESNVWKAFIDAFLLSLLQIKGHQKDVSMKTLSTFFKKVDVSVTRVSPTIPFGFCQDLFKSIDEKIVIFEEKGMYILKDMILGRAVLFAKKLNEFRVGDTILVAAIESNISIEDEEISLMQDLYISSKIEKVYRKWEGPIIDSIIKKLNNDPDVQTFKSTPCERGYGCKGLKLCPHFHNSSDKRRNPLLHKYLRQLCLKPQTNEGLCENGEQCLRSHNYYEEKFHPTEYQAKLCSSGLPSIACNRQKLCMHAHKDSPEMFYVPEWEDLIVTDISNTIYFFAGAIRGTTKFKDIEHFNFRIFLISPSSEFLDTAVKASHCLLRDFKLKVSFLESGTSNADSCEVIVGSPSLFMNVNPNVFLEMSGAIIVDDIHSIFKSVKEKESLFQLFKTIMASSYNIMLNKVFVCERYDTIVSNEILRITGYRARHLRLDQPYKTYNKKETIRNKSVYSPDYVDKNRFDVSENLMKGTRSRSITPKRRLRKEVVSPQYDKVRLVNSRSRSKSKSLHRRNTPENFPYRKSYSRSPHKSRSRSKSLGLEKKVSEDIDRNIALIRYADERTGLEKQGQDSEIMCSQAYVNISNSRSIESYKGDDKKRFHDTNKKSQLKRNNNGSPLEVMPKYKYDARTGSNCHSNDQVADYRKQKRSLSKSLDKNGKKSICDSIYSDSYSTQLIPKGRKRSRSRSVDNTSLSKSINKQSVSSSKLYKQSPPIRARSRSRSSSLELDKTSMLRSLQRCTSQSLSNKSDKRYKLEKTDNDMTRGGLLISIKTSGSNPDESESSNRLLLFEEQKLVNEKINESKLQIFRNSQLSKDKHILPGAISHRKETQEANFENKIHSKNLEKNVGNKNVLVYSDSDLKLIKVDEIEQSRSKSTLPAVGNLPASLGQASSTPKCSPSDSGRQLLGDFLIRERLGVRLYEAYKKAFAKLYDAFEMEYTVYRNIPEVHPNYSDYYATFTARFNAQHGDSNDEIKEKLWKLFWDSKYDEIKEDDWKVKQRNLLKSFEQKVNAEKINPILPAETSPNMLNSPFVFKDALSLIEQLCENIVFLGPSVKSMIEMCRSLGTTTKEAYEVFVVSENVALVQLLMERFKTKSLEGHDNTRQLFAKAIEWIPKILEEAKTGPKAKIEDVTIDLNSIAKISAGKGTDYTLNLIKIALAYEGFTDPPLEVVNEYFMKVCRVHFEKSASKL